MPNLITSRLTYAQGLLDAWEAGNYEMLASSQACEHIKGIIDVKVDRRSGTWFFGEAFVATEFEHEVGFYGSFKWLTNPRFVDGKSFPNSFARKYQEAIRDALWEHFGADQLKMLQQVAVSFFKKHEVGYLRGKQPVAPDLWLIDQASLRFIEVKLPGDWIKPHQLAGLALIGSCLWRRVSDPARRRTYRKASPRHASALLRVDHASAPCRFYKMCGIMIAHEDECAGERGLHGDRAHLASPQRGTMARGTLGRGRKPERRPG